MILIPEQVGAIRNRISELKLNISIYDGYYRDRERIDFGNTKNIFVDGGFIDDQYKMDIKQLREYEQLLKESFFLKEIDIDKISIGTKFAIKFDVEDELMYYTLTENLEGINSSDGFISLHSVLGQSLYGKREKDNFSYEVKVGDTKEVVTGEIASIEKDYNAYVNYIRGRKLSHRMSIREIKNRKNNITCNKEKENLVTLSQFDLLESELERLELGLKKSQLSYANCSMQKRRLNYISKILTDNNIVEPTNDDTVGIGSHVSIMLFEDSGIKTRRAELIQQAVSDELPTDYIEMISSLGMNIFGLKNNDSFSYYKSGFQLVSGMVYDIDNSKDAIRTTDPLVYQKSLKRK